MTITNILTQKEVQQMIDQSIEKQNKKLYKSLDVILKKIYKLEEEIRCLND